MNYWLMKSEPSAFSIDTLQQAPKQIAHWDGVRNYQARNMMRDQMQVGDEAFFYHSSCAEPGIVGMMKIVKAAYPDFTAFDPKNDHYDPSSQSENPRWFMVDVQLIKKFNRVINLAQLKAQADLAKMIALRKGNRLSITPVSATEWHCIMRMSA